MEQANGMPDSDNLHDANHKESFGKGVAISLDPETVDALPLVQGTLVGPYRVESVLGRGGHGFTYLALDLKLRQHVALKEYLPRSLGMRRDGPSVVSVPGHMAEIYYSGMNRFLDEARVLAKFRHPNIVRVLSFHRENNTAYFAMDLEKGHDLADLFGEKGLLDSEFLRLYLPPLVDGLEIMHAMGFVHRDIKPRNIFLRNGITPVLLDFGSVFSPGEEGPQGVGVMPTGGYAAPEEYAEGAMPQGPWTDIYSLAAVFYQAVTGARPPDAPVRLAKVRAGCPDPMTPARECGRQGIEPEVLRFLDMSLSLEHSERPHSMDEVREMLPAAWKGGSDERSVLAPTVLAMPRELRRFRNVLLCGSVAENARVDSVLLQTFFGMRTRHVTHGAEALAMMQRETFDLVLCDVGLADMHAGVLLEAAALKMTWRRPPMLVLCYDPTEQLRIQVAALGGAGILTRPYTEEELEHFLRRLLSWRQGYSVEASLVEQARRAATQGRHSRAMRLYNDLLDVEDEARALGEPSVEDLCWRGMLELALEQADNALEFFIKSEIMLELLAEARAGMADIYRIKGAMKRYIEEAEAAVWQAERFEGMLSRRALLAQIMLRDAPPSNPLRTLGQELEEQGDHNGALPAYEQALSFSPSDPDSYCSIARMHLHLGDRGAARTALERALRCSPGHESAALLLKRC